MRRFYQNQDDLIDDYERTEKQANNDPEEQDKSDNLNRKTKKKTQVLSRASLAVNIVSVKIDELNHFDIVDFRHYSLVKLWLQYYLDLFRLFQLLSIRLLT